MASILAAKFMSSFSIDPKFTPTLLKLFKPKLIRVRLSYYHEIKTKDIFS